MRQKKIIHSQAFVIILAGYLTLKNIRGKKIISTYLVSLSFILLSWISDCNAQNIKSHSASLFDQLIEKIHAHTHCGIKYNPSQQAAIVNTDCSSATYINFKTRQTFVITQHQLAGRTFPTWIDDNIATVESSCGTGCVKVIIFSAPATAVACSDYEYRISFLNKNEPPDYYHNRPLLIDPKRKIFVCYDNEKNIQVFPIPQQATIHPPEGYFSEKAIIRDNQLVVIYKNGHDKTKKIAYGKLGM